MILPIVLAGGQGARFWPVSHLAAPKPVIRFEPGDTLLQATFRRLGALASPLRPVLVCNAAQHEVMRAQIAETGAAAPVILLEPEPRGTAPAICCAALWAMRQGLGATPLLILPSDHVIGDEAALVRALQSAESLALAGRIIVFAVTPDRPSTSYGYLELGDVIDAKWGHYQLERFVEKPPLDLATRFLKTGRHFWNSGIVLATAHALIAAFQETWPDILAACDAALPGEAEANVVSLDRTAFARAEAISFDHAVMEHVKNAAAVRAEFGWRDFGDWNALWQASDKDKDGNVLRGNASGIDSRNSLLESHGPKLVGVGLDDIVAIATPDAVLITRRERAGEIGQILKRLKLT